MVSSDRTTSRRSGIGLLGRLIPGVGRISSQIEPFADAWRHETAAALSGSDRILGVLGDSTAQGIGAESHRGGWVGQLHTWLEETTSERWAIANWSQSGAKVADVIDDQLPALLAGARKPDLTLVAVGANDMFWSVRVAPARHGFATLIPRLPDGSAIGTVPAQGLAIRSQSLNRSIRRIAAEHGAEVAAVDRAISSGRGRLASDGFHPNERGYADWADAYRVAVDRVLVHRL